MVAALVISITSILLALASLVIAVLAWRLPAGNAETATLRAELHALGEDINKCWEALNSAMKRDSVRAFRAREKQPQLTNSDPSREDLLREFERRTQ